MAENLTTINFSQHCLSRTWQQFQAHFDMLAEHGIVRSIKDFYWDVRPKPEYGTIELRVLDTPLWPAFAAALACYERELWLEFFSRPGTWPTNKCKELYVWNRFNAAKDGVNDIWIDPETGLRHGVMEIVSSDLARLSARSTDQDFGKACDVIKELMAHGGQAGWLKTHLRAGAGTNTLARVASELFDQP